MDKNIIDKLLKNGMKSSYDLIEVLQDVQENYNYLPENVLIAISEKLIARLRKGHWAKLNFFAISTVNPTDPAA